MVTTDSPSARTRRVLRPVSDYLERQLEGMLYGDIGMEEMFLAPRGEPALVSLDSVTAEIYRHPLVLFIGGIMAVILELAEPRVRHGVWEHSIFPHDPVLRLRRTGLSTMVTFYAAQSVARKMIAEINDRHRKIAGVTPGGETYRASDPDLLAFVQATASFGFLSAYHAYMRPLTDDAWAASLKETAPAAALYGVPSPPTTRAELSELIMRHEDRLVPSETLETFLCLMRETPALPRPGQLLQPLFVRAAIDLLPRSVATRLELTGCGLGAGARLFVKNLVVVSRAAELRNHPVALARMRLNTGETAAA